MADDPKPDPKVEKPDEGQEKKNNDLMPRYRFNEVNDKLKTVTAELEKFQKASKDAEQKKLEEEGKYNEVLTELKSDLERFKGKAGEWDEYQSKKKGELLKLLPEDRRDEFENQPLNIVESVVAMIDSKKPPKIDADPSNRNAGDLGEKGRKEFLSKSVGEQRKDWGKFLDSFNNKL